MTRSTLSRRVTAMATIPLVSVLALAGCAKASHAGAAATIGGTRISTIDLQGVVDRGLADPQAAQQLGAQKEDFQRQVLTRLIQGVLVDKLAAREKVTVTQQQIDARRAEYAKQAGGDTQLVTQAAQNGVGVSDLPNFIRTIVLRDAVGDKLVAGVTVPDAQLQALYAQGTTYDQVHAAHILVKDEATAKSVLAQVTADPSQFAALAKKYSIDTSNKDSGGDLGLAGKGQFVAEFEKAIFAGKVGTIIGPVKTTFGYHVIKIIEHKKTTFEQAKADLTKQALTQQRSDALDKALSEEAKKDGVSVSPRFGRWDAAQAQVVAPASSLSSPGATTAPSPGATDGSTGLPAPATVAPSPSPSS